MKDKVLNITNGDYFNEYFKKKFGEISVSFCEAMMDGETVKNIYSQEFVVLRAKSLNVTIDEYKTKMHVPDALKGNNYEKISLWFGKDTFCQMNLLTLLAYLEQIKYQGEIKLNYIDDETFAVLESNIDVKLGIYNKIYEDVLILNKVLNDVGVLNSQAIDLYFDYKKENGKLVKLVKANLDKNKNELISILLKQSKEYGLSDLQAERIINRFYYRINKTL